MDAKQESQEINGVHSPLSHALSRNNIQDLAIQKMYPLLLDWIWDFFVVVVNIW